MSIYDVYEEQKVPTNHRVKKIVPDYWEYLSLVKNIDFCEKELKINFSSDKVNYSIFLGFPKIGGIRINGNKKGFFESENLKILYKNNKEGFFAYTNNEYKIFVKKSDKIDITFYFNNIKFFHLTDSTLALGYKQNKEIKFSFNGKIHDKEKIFGFGEKFNSINQVGNQLPIFNDDTGYHGHPEEGDKTRSYKNVPIFHSTSGYTVFLNSFYGAVADFTVNNNTEYNIQFNNSLLDIYFWGDSILNNLDCYTQLTGRSFLPPKWSFGYWAGGCAHNWQSDGKEIEQIREKVKNVIKGYQDLETVPAAFYGEADPSWDEECYKYFSEFGIHMLGWNHPGVDFTIKKYSVDKIKEIFPLINNNEIPMFHDPNSDEIIDKPLYYIDYSNPKALDLINNKYNKYWKMGLNGVMVDFGEYVYEETKAYNGMLGDEMHNFYGYCYPKAMYLAWEKVLNNKYILFARSACAGSQKWACFFGGDQKGEFYGLRQVYYGGLNANASGLTIWGSDIGSLMECQSKELYIRWLQFATFSPLMRAHGNHNPWDYDKECCDIFKKYFWLRENIKDYIYSSAIKSNLFGKPMMSNLSIYFQDESSLRNIDDEYMFGDDLLVCPVLFKGMMERKIFFPKGEWTDLWNSELYVGDCKKTIAAPIEKCPVFIEQGSVIPVKVSSEGKLFSLLSGDIKKGLIITLGNKKDVFYQNNNKKYEFISTFCNQEAIIKNPQCYCADFLLIYRKIKKIFSYDEELDFRITGNMSVVDISNLKCKEFRIVC